MRFARPVLLYLAALPLLFGQPVIDAVHKGHGVGREADGVAAVRQALENGGSVNQRDKSGWTPLMHSALECRPAIIQLLLDRGADPQVRAASDRKTDFMDHGQSALGIAASCFIARRRASLAPERGMSPEYVQSERDAARSIARNLIRHGAKVNQPDADGRTPLMMAVMHGWDDVAEELLAAGADVRRRDAEGRSVLDYAAPSANALIARLKSAGAPPESGQSGRTVCDAEIALNRLGYDTPIIDCIWGRQLSAVVVKFQNSRQLKPSGELDAETRAALNIR